MDANSAGATIEAQRKVRKAMAKTTAASNTKLAFFLAMAMFILVVDTSFMNVSIASIVKSLDTTVSALQATIALEALISAAFILIASKVADLIGRKLAFILGVCAYGVGALALTFSTNLPTIVVLWAIVGGIGAALLLPAMQSLIHGNFSGAAQKKVYALVGATAAIAAATGPLLGGIITTFLSYRFAFFLEFIVVLVVLFGTKLIRDIPYKGDRRIDLGSAFLSVVGMGGVVLGILMWQEGLNYVGVTIVIGLVTLILLGFRLVHRAKEGLPVLLDPKLFTIPTFRLGISSQMMQNIVLGGSMIALPIFLQMSLEYSSFLTGLSIAPLSLSMFFVALWIGRKAKGWRSSSIIRTGFMLTTLGILLLIPTVPFANSGWALFIPLLIVGSGLGLLVSQLNNYSLAPIDEKRVTEAAGVNSAAGSFGLSFGLAMAGGVMLAVLVSSFTTLTNASTTLPPEDKTTIIQKLNTSAAVVSNADLQTALEGQPEDVQQEVLDINTQAVHRALQAALLVPLFAAAIGIFLSFRMVRLPELKPANSAESLLG